MDSAVFQSSTINMGGGADFISAAAMSGQVTINLDALGSEFFGKDTLNLGGTLLATSKIIGGGGADSIILSATLDDGSLVAGNNGRDSITISAISAGASATVNGGAGADVINITASLGTGTLGVINGGGGGDVIDMSASLASAIATVDGGAGSDTINLGATIASSQIVLNYDAASESNISAIDVVSSTVNINAGFMIRAGGYMSASTALTTAADLNNGKVTTLTAGNATFTATIANGVTARAAELDSLLGVGMVAAFSDNTGTDFIFIQGGAAGGGTADDLLVQTNTLTTATGSFVINGGTAIEVNLGA
jgi:hypothetical protein